MHLKVATFNLCNRDPALPDINGGDQRTLDHLRNADLLRVYLLQHDHDVVFLQEATAQLLCDLNIGSVFVYRSGEVRKDESKAAVHKLPASQTSYNAFLCLRPEPKTDGTAVLVRRDFVVSGIRTLSFPGIPGKSGRVAMAVFGEFNTRDHGSRPVCLCSFHFEGYEKAHEHRFWCSEMLIKQLESVVKQSYPRCSILLGGDTNCYGGPNGLEALVQSKTGWALTLPKEPTEYFGRSTDGFMHPRGVFLHNIERYPHIGPNAHKQIPDLRFWPSDHLAVSALVEVPPYGLDHKTALNFRNVYTESVFRRMSIGHKPSASDSDRLGSYMESDFLYLVRADGLHAFSIRFQRGSDSQYWVVAAWVSNLLGMNPDDASRELEDLLYVNFVKAR